MENTLINICLKTIVKFHFKTYDVFLSEAKEEYCASCHPELCYQLNQIFPRFQILMHRIFGSCEGWSKHNTNYLGPHKQKANAETLLTVFVICLRCLKCNLDPRLIYILITQT